MNGKCSSSTLPNRLHLQNLENFEDSQHHWSTLSLLPTMFTLTTKTISLFFWYTPAMAQLEATNWKQISPPPSPIQVENDLFLKKKTTISRALNDILVSKPVSKPKMSHSWLWHFGFETKNVTLWSRDMVIAIPNNQPKNPQLISNLLIVTPMSVEKQDKVNNADSAFIFLIIQSQNQWSGWSGRRRWPCLVWSLLER